MLERIRPLIVPPILDDEDKTRRARLLHGILIITGTLNALDMLLLVIFAPETLPTFWVNGLFFAAIGLSFQMMRRGHVKASAFAYCVSLWMLLTLYLAGSGGVTSPALGFLTIVIIVGSILLDIEGAVAFGSLCVVTVVLLYWAGSSGWLTMIEGPPTPSRIFATETAIFISLSVLMGLAARNIRSALTRARQSERWLVERNSQLETQIAARQQVEEAYHVLVEHSAQGLIIIQDDRIVFANPRICQMLGYSAEELMAVENVADLLHPEEREAAVVNLTPRLSQEAASAEVELRVLHKDRHYVWLEVFITAINYQGKLAIQTASVDITERKRAEEAQRTSEERFRRTFEDAPMGMALVGLDLRPVNVNNRLCEMLGYSSDELIALTFPEFTHPDDIDIDVQLAGQVFRGEIPRYRIDKRYLKKSGDLVWGQLTVSAVHDAEGRQIYALGMVEDISKRKQAEEALRLSQEMFSKAFHSSPTPIVISTLNNGRIIDVNESCQRALEYTRDELVGHTALELQIWVDLNAREETKRLFGEQGTIRQREVQFRVHSGEVRSALASFELIELNGESCLLTSWLDITERIQSEQALRQSEERFYKAFHANPLAITLSTLDEGRFVDVNESSVQLFDYSREELIGHTAVELNLWNIPKDRDTMIATLREGGTIRQMETALRTKSGEIRPNFLSVEIIKIGQQELLLGMLEDITEIKRAEAIEREQRLFAEALGDVAAVLNSTLELDVVLDQILTQVARVVPYDAASIMLIEADTAYVVRSKGFAERGVEQIMTSLRFPVDQTNSSHPTVIEDTRTHPGWTDIPEMRWIRSLVSAPIRTGEDLVGFLDLIYTEPGSLTDSHSERLQAFASQASTAIRNAQLYEQLRRLTHQMVSVQEEERKRISRELHDEAGQAMIALKMSLEAVRHSLPLETDNLYARLGDAIGVADITMEQIRLLAHNLRPAVLDTLGLNLALQGQCHDFTRRTGLYAAYSGTELASLPDAVSVCLYRILQEGLTNIAKHSQATRVQVALHYQANLITLLVEDNGTGFDAEVAISNQRRGVGMIGMQERLRLLDGWLEIIPSPGHGLRLLASIPWEAQQ